MSVEGGGISIGGGGPSIGGGVGISAGPSVGAPGGEFGPGAGIGSTIVNEGPVTPGFLENTMPLTLNNFKSTGEITFNPLKGRDNQPVLNEQEAVREAEHWLGISSQDVHPVSLPVERENVGINQSAIRVLPMPAYQPWIEPNIQPDIQPFQVAKIALEGANLTKTNRKVVQIAQPVAAPISVPEQQIFKEEVLVEERKEKIYKKEEEQVEEVRLKYLLDEEAADERVSELGRAIELARKDAEKNSVSGIEGWRIVKFLRLHTGLISRLVRGKGSDGSLDETIADLLSRKFATEGEAKQYSAAVVFEKEPVRQGKEGRGVKEGSVERVLKFPIARRGIPEEEVVARIIKKQKVQSVLGQTVSVAVEPAQKVKEPSIEDYPDLAALFPKAA